jgi:hypothetical protein
MSLGEMYGRTTVRPIVDTATTNGIAISPQKNNGDNGVSNPLSPFCICHCGMVGARAARLTPLSRRLKERRALNYFRSLSIRRVLTPDFITFCTIK